MGSRARALAIRIVAAVAAVGALVLVAGPTPEPPHGHAALTGRLPKRLFGHRHGRGRPARRPVPILMYHQIEPPSKAAAMSELYVSPRAFRLQMRGLRRLGYRAVTLRRVFQYWAGRASLPRHPVVITFDDGYRSQYSQALPVLRRLGWRGVLDLTVANVGATIDPDMVTQLVHRGWEIDAHTISHPDLVDITAASLRREVAGSREAIRHRWKVRADFFAYPDGAYSRRVVRAVRRAGFRGALAAGSGLGRRGQRYALRRVHPYERDRGRTIARRVRALR